jgi:hypothetical protein
MTNQEFCYWLQGYFEISETTAFTQQKIILINQTLGQIHEPLGKFTQWLLNINHFLIEENYKQDFLDFFVLEIKYQLNNLFTHVIEADTHDPI